MAPAFVEHVIIIAAYKESLATLQQTLAGLASHGRASTYTVCLALEANEPGADLKAQMLLDAFARYFGEMTFTIHPSDVIGGARRRTMPADTSRGRRQSVQRQTLLVAALGAILARTAFVSSLSHSRLGRVSHCRLLRRSRLLVRVSTRLLALEAHRGLRSQLCVRDHSPLTAQTPTCRSCLGWSTSLRSYPHSCVRQKPEGF